MATNVEDNKNRKNPLSCSPVQLTFDFPKCQDQTFDNYIVDPTNQLAYKTALMFCQDPDFKYDKLFFYGAAGQGKTHLLKSIGNDLSRRSPPKNILYLSAKTIFEHYTHTHSYTEVVEVSNQYKNVDVLLLDDIHLIEDDNFVQDQVFHIYNDLMNKGRRIVIAGQKAPNKMTTVQKHLQSRLLSTIITKVDTISSDETKKKILQQIAKTEGVCLSDNITNYLLTHFSRDLFDSKNLFKTINSYSLSHKKKISIPLIKELTLKKGTLYE